MFVTYYRAMIPHEALTDEQARLVSTISSRLSPQDSVRFLSNIYDQVCDRAGISDDELQTLITQELIGDVITKH